MFDQCHDEALLRNVPKVRVVPVPRPGPGMSPEMVAKNAVAFLMDALTNPLNKEETVEGRIDPSRPDRIAFQGTFDEVQQFFIGDPSAFKSIEPHCKWTDGLPIIPPTEAKVKAFLDFTSRDPEEDFEVMNMEPDVGGQLVPLGFRYNVEKVAVNAVMAGCTPEMMPICLAIAETHPGRYITTTPSADFGVVTGPISKKIGMATRRNAMMTGNLANASLGRFMTLFRHNIARFIPDVTMQHTQGNPLNKGLIFAENYEGSPWTNLSQEFGFDRSENTFTRFHTKGLIDFGMTMYGAHFSHAYGFKSKYKTPRGGFLNFAMNLMKASAMPKYFILLLCPEDARRLAIEDGFKTKDEARQWLYDNCTETYGEHKKKQAWPPHDIAPFPAGHPMFPRAVNQLDAMGLTEDQITDETKIHLPLFGPDYFHIVHLGSGTPLPTLIRGDRCMTVSIDKWR